MTENAKDLKPCPECGHEKLYVAPTKVTVSCQLTIKCMLCNFTVKMDDWNSLVRFWNSLERATPETSGDDVEELAYQLCKMLADDFHAETPAYFKEIAGKLVEQGFRRSQVKEPATTKREEKLIQEKDLRQLERMIDKYLEQTWREPKDLCLKAIFNFCAKFGQPPSPGLSVEDIKDVLSVEFNKLHKKQDEAIKNGDWGIGGGWSMEVDNMLSTFAEAIHAALPASSVNAEVVKKINKILATSYVGPVIVPGNFNGYEYQDGPEDLLNKIKQALEKFSAGGAS